jgi:hypothetical protein
MISDRKKRYSKKRYAFFFAQFFSYCSTDFDQTLHKTYLPYVVVHIFRNSTLTFFPGHGDPKSFKHVFAITRLNIAPRNFIFGLPTEHPRLRNIYSGLFNNFVENVCIAVRIPSLWRVYDGATRRRTQFLQCSFP